MNTKSNKKLALPSQSDQQNYEVGYAKPPVSTRFKPGVSGNPHGRPRGAKKKKPEPSEERLKQIILDEAYRHVTINEGGKKNSISMAEAVMRSITVNAAKGEPRAQKIFIELLNKTEASRKEQADEYLNIAIEYKQFWEKKLEQRQSLSTHVPEPLPHPDDIIIDMKTGKVSIHGPMTKEEKIEWDKLLEKLHKCENEIQTLKRQRTEPKYKDYINLIEEDIAHETKIRNILKERLGEYGKRNNK